MAAGPAVADHTAMPPSRVALPPVRRIVLVPASAAPGRADAVVRRYRLARLRLERCERPHRRRDGAAGFTPP